MFDHRPFATLGHANHGWLNARHHFSFANYHDPVRMGVGPIRVWNDDEIAARSGFPMHAHRDMEIVTYVRAGAITHRDSLGNEGRTEAGDVQVMSAGTGLQHSEMNAEDVETRIFQIWIEPRAPGGEPRWDAAAFPDVSGARLAVLASGHAADRADGALEIRADARVLGATLASGDSVDYAMRAGSVGYLVPSEGRITVNDVALNARDGLAIEDAVELTIRADTDARFLFVEAG